MASNLLQKPYYLEEDTKKNWIKIFFLSAFVFFFLFVFRPFQINEYLGNTFLLVLGYSIVTFATTVLFILLLPKIFPRWFNPEEWTTAKEIIHILSLIFVIGLGNALYSAQAQIISSFQAGLLYFELYTFAVAVIPVVFIVLFTEKKDAMRHDLLSEEIMQRGILHKEEEVPQPMRFRLQAQNGKDSIEVNPEHILYVKSDANYVEVFSHIEQAIQKQLLRNTLTVVENQLQAQGRFFRCHKSYIINLEQVERVSGNAQGLKVHLAQLEEVVPVSRKNNGILKELLAV